MGKKTAEKSAESVKSAKPKKVETKKRVSVKSAETKAASFDPRAKTSCQFSSCKREYRAKGYCDVHYKQWKRGKFGLARYKTCGDFDCKKPMGINRHGYCEDHFQNYYVKGMAVTKAAPETKQAPEKKEAAG